MHTNQDYGKITKAIRYWMHGKEYFAGLKAMEFGALYHTGTRKDGKTPEFQHQVSQANYCRTLEKYLLAPQDTLATIFLHDVVEDYDVTIDTIEKIFGKRIADAVERLTNKNSDGTKKPLEQYYGAIEENPISSIAKGCDRMHNLQSMQGVATFTPEKQMAYIEETRTHILPMLKKARRFFPEQEPAYENIKHGLLLQVDLIQLIHQ